MGWGPLFAPAIRPAIFRGPFPLRGNASRGFSLSPNNRRSRSVVGLRTGQVTAGFCLRAAQIKKEERPVRRRPLDAWGLWSEVSMCGTSGTGQDHRPDSLWRAGHTLCRHPRQSRCFPLSGSPCQFQPRDDSDRSRRPRPWSSGAISTSTAVPRAFPMDIGFSRNKKAPHWEALKVAIASVAYANESSTY